MEEDGGDQQYLKTDNGNLQPHYGDMSLQRHNVQLSERLENSENMASSSNGPDRLQHLSVSKPNLLHDVQNLTGSPYDEKNLTGSLYDEKDLTGSPYDEKNLHGSPCRSSGKSQRNRNSFNPFSPKSRRSSLFGQNNSYEREQFPTSMYDRNFSPSRLFSQPYQVGSRYMSSPRTASFQDMPTPDTPWNAGGDNSPKKEECSVKDGKADNQQQVKEKKSITTKTFAHGMMDVSLLTSNSTQLRAVLSNPDHEFYTLLLWLIGLSIVLQISSAVLLIMSDYLKTQVKEKDLQNQKKRKLLNFLSLALVTIVTSINVLMSAFSTPSYPQQRFKHDVPAFSSVNIPWGHNRTEL